MEVRSRLVTVKMHHNSTAHLHPVRDIQFASTDQRDITKPEHSRTGCGELTMEVIGCRKQDTDKCVVIDSVPSQHLGDERLRLRIDLSFGVFFAGRRAS